MAASKFHTPDFLCPCCGNSQFSYMDVLWPELVSEWKLSKAEEAYINRQQALSCGECRSNLRSMTLAKAIMNAYGAYGVTFKKFLLEHKNIKLLELNTAGTLHPFFADMKNHILAEYPEVDIMELPYEDNSFDMIIHSDTLEHVEDPVKGLKETLRVLKPGGYTCYTIPLVVGRLSKQRPAKARASYHGIPGQEDYLVKTEFGSDMWTQVMEAGFRDCHLTTLEYPSSIAISARKEPEATDRSKYHSETSRRWRSIRKGK